MTRSLLALAWAGLVVGAAARWRLVAQARTRLQAAAPGTRHGSSGDRSGSVTTRTDLVSGALDGLGRAVLRLVPGRARAHPSPAQARHAGLLAGLAACSIVLAPPLVPAVLLAGWTWSRARDRGRERRRLATLEAGLPELVDLLALSVGAGANVTLAVAAAGRRGTGPLAAELRRVTAEVERGRRVADVLDELPDRCGEAVRPLASVLASCARYGSPLGPALERLGDDVRRRRQRRAEEAARKVPVLLLFPLVLCVLPSFALLTVAPLVAGALRSLRL